VFRGPFFSGHGVHTCSVYDLLTIPLGGAQLLPARMRTKGLSRDGRTFPSFL